MKGSFSTTRCTDNHAPATGLARLAPGLGLGLALRLAPRLGLAPATRPGLALELALLPGLVLSSE